MVRQAQGSTSSPTANQNKVLIFDFDFNPFLYTIHVVQGFDFDFNLLSLSFAFKV